MNGDVRPLIRLHGEIKTPPFTLAARREAGRQLFRLQRGETIGMPLSRPMPSIGARCHELRIRDAEHNWRIIYRIDPAGILIVDVFAKTTRQTPKHVIAACKSRLKRHDNAAGPAGG